MKHLGSIVIIISITLCYGTALTQKNLKFNRIQLIDSHWDQGVPLDSADTYIRNLILQIDQVKLMNPNSQLTKQEAVVCREIAIAFYNRGIYDAADWYLNRAKDYVEIVEVKPESVTVQVPLSLKERLQQVASQEQIKSLEQDVAFLESIPDSYNDLNETQLKELSKRIDKQLERLTKEKQDLIENNANLDIIKEKDKTINNLEKEKRNIELTVQDSQLRKEISKEKSEKNSLYRYIITLAIIAGVLFLIASFFILRRRVAYKETVILKQKNKFAEFEQFVDSSVLVSKTDAHGKIIYVNEKFQQVSGWTMEEAVGQDHRIVNSGYHPNEFWKIMYDVTVRQRKIWNEIVTNKNKSGEMYWVDSYIKANFDDSGKLQGFTSIRYDVTDVVKNAQEIEKQNTYLEHAAKILRHDMHSGINTYIPRGISSLERRLTADAIQTLKLEAPLKMIREGLTHTQKVYKGVYEFTNLVKKDVVLNKESHDLKQILESYLNSTSYKSQVIIEDLVVANVNDSLFCTAVDNLIRNGLKYNDSSTKFVRIFIENDELVIQDNGRGLTQEEFNHLSKPYTRKPNQQETGTGLGLNICVAILTEHGFTISCDKNEIGTKIKINMGV
jgi:PAS domain S-box-containing protein